MTGSQDNNAPYDTSNREPHHREFHRERLSAMVDGMLSTDEARFLLRRMEHDDELADCWQRWQLYGDAMRGQAGRALPADFAQRVGRAIADDQAAGQSEAASGQGRARRPFLLWGGGGALAASVALAVLLGPRWMAPQDASAPPVVADVAAPPVVIPSPVLVAPASSADAASAATQVATAATMAAAVAQSRTQKRHLMAASHALAADTTASAAHAPVEVASAAGVRHGATDHPGQTAAKPWPTALVPGIPASDNIADYRIDVAPVSPFHPGFELPVSEPQAEPPVQPPAAATTP